MNNSENSGFLWRVAIIDSFAMRVTTHSAIAEVVATRRAEQARALAFASAIARCFAGAFAGLSSWRSTDVEKNRGRQIIIRRSKTDQEGHGETIAIDLPC